MLPNEKEFSALMSGIFSKNGLSSLLSKEKNDQFYALTNFLLTENEKFNLTAITDPEKIVLSHYADCAALAARLPKGAKIADIGCGAGFPTLPIAILRADVGILAVDSTAKRVDFVARAASLLGLSNVGTKVARAEDLGADEEYREKFDVVTARAVAETRVLAELCLPLVRVGGAFIAMKGKNAAFEVADAKRAIAILGGKPARIEEIGLTDGKEDFSHPLVLVEKGAKTPKDYPRPYAKISKKPL